MTEQALVIKAAEKALQRFTMGADLAETIALVRENLSGAAVTPWDLRMFKVPSGGSTFWTLKTADGPKALPELEGIILGITPVRSFYKQAYTGGTGSPPDCFSPNLLDGEGDNGSELGTHDCVTCPQNQWGTGHDAQGNPSGKACKERRLLLVKLAGSGLLPAIVVVPPTSLGNLQEYLLNSLTDAGMPYYGVSTKMGLVPSPTGAAMITFAIGEKLMAIPDYLATIRDYIKQLKPLFEQVGKAASDLD